MKFFAVLAFASAMAATPAFAQAPSAQEFVNKVAVSDMFEIQSSRLAATKADANSKSFAERMIKDHTKTTEELKALAGKLKLTLPAALDAEHQGKIDKLQKLDGDAFDDAYDSMQVEAHQTAVKLFEAYAQSGDNPDLKQWAAKTLPHLKEHLTMATKLK